MSCRPLHDRVLIRRIDQEEKLRGGIIEGEELIIM